MNKIAYFIVLYWSRKYMHYYLWNNIKWIVINQNGLSLLVNTKLPLCFVNGHYAELS